MKVGMQVLLELKVGTTTNTYAEYKTNNMNVVGVTTEGEHGGGADGDGDGYEYEEYHEH